MLWMVGAYFILTIGEVLLYGTMLDLSYAYAPARMKSLITACFLLTNTLGNLLNTQYGKFYFSGLGKGEELIQSLEWGARGSTPSGATVYRLIPKRSSPSTRDWPARPVVFFFVARRFNRSVQARQRLPP